MDSLAIFVDVESWLVRQEPWCIAVSALLLISAVAAVVLSVRFFMKAICEARVLRVERGSERLLLARQLYNRYESTLDRVSPHIVRYVSCKSKGQFDRFDGFRAQQTLVEYVSLNER